MQQHKWISKALCQIKKSQTQKTILYNPMNILNSRKGKTIIIGKQISQEPREGEKKTDCSKGAWEIILGWKKCSISLLLLYDYTLFKTNQIVHLKLVSFTVNMSIKLTKNIKEIVFWKKNILSLLSFYEDFQNKQHECTKYTLLIFFFLT